MKKKPRPDSSFCLAEPREDKVGIKAYFRKSFPIDLLIEYIGGTQMG